MATVELPPVPDFAAIEAEAPKNADRQTALLALIGNLVFVWSNNESMFIYVLMILLETDEATAAVVFVTLNTTRARLDLIQRLAGMKIRDAGVARTLQGLVKQFNSCTRLRNEFNHCTYAVNQVGEITHIQTMKIQEGRGQMVFGSTRKVDAELIEELLNAMRRMKRLNRELWAFLPTLRDAVAASRKAALS